FSGAVLLAGEAAFRIGAGWVTLCIPSGLHPSLIPSFPEATWLPVSDNPWVFDRGAAEAILGSLERVSSMLIGPGLGISVETQAFIDKLISPELPPMVVDADGLKLLSNQKAWWEHLPSESILTPHPGEMSILTGLSIHDIQGDRIQVAEKYAQEWGHVVVLKGAFTVVADPSGKSAILPIATPALGRAGTGDVLAGMITGLLAQGISAFESASAGVWLHAMAGLLSQDVLGSAAGVLAGDLIRQLPSLLPY
ncbi:MAG: NAD(P)H-hydrate dehydratase, partial [Anaerolineales bacterium]